MLLNKYNKNRSGFIQYRSHIGFTLVELLVVIAIIGILSTAAVVNLRQFKAKARDARRLSDIIQMKKALEVYYYTFGEYPNSDPSGIVCRGLIAVCACNTILTNPITTWIPDLTLLDNPQLPVDPLNIKAEDGTMYYYFYTRTSSEPPSYKDYYYIMYNLETQPVKDECNGHGYAGWSCTSGGNIPL